MHKMREFRELFKGIKAEEIELLSLANFSDYTPPEEDGKSFKENALIKARHAAKYLKKWSLADDSGLVVPALGMEPGIHSRRYAGEQATDSDNRKKLLKSMQGLKDLERQAYFECAIALCGPDGEEKCFSGRCEGLILDAERGRNGFGYDSLFKKYDYEKSFAELDPSVKNKISHRAKAFERLLASLSYDVNTH
jgi:XTP/dITP diphosphohydrolase